MEKKTRCWKVTRGLVPLDNNPLREVRMTFYGAICRHWATTSTERTFITIGVFYCKYIADTIMSCLILPWVQYCPVSTYHRPARYNGPYSKVHGAYMGAHLGPTEPRWATCWPNEPCYQGDIAYCKQATRYSYSTHHRVDKALMTRHRI